MSGLPIDSGPAASAARANDAKAGDAKAGAESPGPDSRPRIAPGYRLQWEDAQAAHVLLYPEGMIKLNQSGGEILKRCDGERTLAQITADLEQAFNASGLAADVTAFIEMAGKQRWLVWSRQP